MAQSTLQPEITRILAQLRALLNEGKDEFPVLLQGFVELEMEDNRNATYPSTSDKLRNVSGRLGRSFGIDPDEDDNRVSKLELTGYNLHGVFGSEVPYAAIHNFGGTISNGFGRGIEINMPERPYFTPGIERFEQTGAAEMIQELRNRIIVLMNREFGTV